MAFIGMPTIAASTLDGINFREIVAIGIVTLCGLVIAVESDKFQDELDHLENRLRHKK